MIAGQLEIQLLANMARLQADMDKAKQAVGGAMAAIEKSAALATKALAGIGIGLSVVALVGFIKNAIQAGDEMGKMAQKIGVNVQQVAGLQLAFQQAGLGAADMQKGLGKLAVGIAEGSDALKAMGVVTKNTDGTLKSTREVLGSVSDKFAGYADGAAKTALAIKLFGKSGADLIPLLNGGGQALSDFDAMAEKLGLTMDKTATDQAEKFNDTIELVGLGLTGVSRRIGVEMLPVLSGLADQFFTSMTEGDRLKKVADFLSTGLKGLYVVALGVVEVFTTVGKVVGGAAAAIGAALSGDFAGAVAIMKDARADIGAGWKSTLSQMSAAWNATGSASLEATAKIQSGLKGAAPVVADVAKKAKEAADEFGKLRDKINGKDSGTDADFIKNLMLLKQGFDSGRVSLAQYLELANKYVAQQKYSVDAAKVAEEAQKALNKVMEEYAESNQKGVAEAVAAAVEAEKKLATYGMLESAVQSLTLAHLVESRELAALAGEDVANIEKRIEAQKRLIAATTALEGREVAEKQFKALNDESKKFTDDLNRGLTDSLFRAFESGRGFFSTLWSGVKNLFKTTALKLIVNAVVGGVMGTAGSTASAAVSALGGGGSILSTISSLGSVVTGLGGTVSAFTSAFGAAVGGAGTVGGGASLFGAAVGQGSISGMAAGAGQMLGAMGPVGWIALAALAAFTIFKKDKIASTSTGSLSRNYNDDGSVRSSESMNIEGNAGYVLETLHTTFKGVQALLGAKGGASFAYGAHTGNDGDKPEFRIMGNGYDSGLTAKTDAAMQLAASRVVFAALKSSELPRELAGLFNGLDPANMSAEQINSVYEYGQALKTLDVTIGAMNFGALKEMSYDMAQMVINMSGGLEGLNTNLASFYENFYTAEEKRANINKGILKTLNDASGGNFTQDWVNNASLAQYRTIAEDKNSSPQLVAAMIALGGAFAGTRLEIEQTTVSVNGVTTTFDDTKEAADALAATNKSLSDQLAILKGTETERSLALRDATDETTKSLLRQIHAQQDLNEAITSIRGAVGAVNTALRSIGEAVEGFADAARSALAGVGNASKNISDALFAAEDAQTAAQERVNDIVRDRMKTIDDFLNDMSGTNRTESLTSLKARLSATSVLAAGGDSQAQGNLIKQAQAVLKAAEAGSTSRADFARSEAFVRSQLLTVRDAGARFLDKAPGGKTEPMGDFETAWADLDKASSDVKHLLELAVATGSSTNKSLREAAGSVTALASDYNRAVVASTLAQNDYSAVLAATQGLQLTTGNRFTSLNTSLADLTTANTDLFNSMVQALSASKTLDDQIAGMLGLTGEAATTLAGLLADPGTAATTLATLLAGPGAESVTSVFGTLIGDLQGFGAAIRGLSLPVSRGVVPTNPTYSSADINAYINSVPSDTEAGIRQIYARAVETGTTSAQIDAARKLPPGTALATALSLGLPAFADGGVHTGGWAMVGERGPELAYMPPARIYSADQTRSMSGGNNDGLITEIRALRAEVAGLKKAAEATARHTEESSRTMTMVTRGGRAIQTEAFV